MRALVLERNKMVGRRLVRYLHCAGYEAMAVEEPADVAKHLDGCQLIGADSFDGDIVVQAIRDRPQLRGLLWTAEPMKPTLRHVVETPQISNVFGRPDFDTPPHAWEFVMAARRIRRAGRGGPPFASFLHWGFGGFQEQVTSSQHRDQVVAKVERFVDGLRLPKRVSEMFAELAHELLMNAMYGAPVNAGGTAKYAGDRKEDLRLVANEQPVLRIASDGVRLALQVVDHFGRLERQHVFGGLARGLLCSGEMDRSRGGAGLGMVVCHHATAALFFDVQRGRKTEATGIFDLDRNLREFRARAKSLHYFEETHDGVGGEA